MMWRPEWPSCYQRGIDRKFASNRMDLCRFQRLLQGEGRKNGWKAFGQHGFACPGWPDQYCIMTTGCCYFQRSFDILLTFYIGKIKFKIILRMEEFLSRIYFFGLQGSGIIKKFDHFSNMAHPINI